MYHNLFISSTVKGHVVFFFPFGAISKLLVLLVNRYAVSVMPMSGLVGFCVFSLSLNSLNFHWLLPRYSHSVAIDPPTSVVPLICSFVSAVTVTHGLKMLNEKFRK